MFSIADGPALGGYFAIPRIRGLTVCGRDHLLEVDLLRPDGGGWRPTVWAGRLDEPVPPRPAFIGRQVSACEGGAVTYLARSAAQPGRDALWRREPGGRAYEVAVPANGIAGYSVARRSGHLVYATRAHPHTDARGDRLLRGRRAEAGGRRAPGGREEPGRVPRARG